MSYWGEKEEEVNVIILREAQNPSKNIAYLMWPELRSDTKIWTSMALYLKWQRKSTTLPSRWIATQTMNYVEADRGKIEHF